MNKKKINMKLRSLAIVISMIFFIGILYIAGVFMGDHEEWVPYAIVKLSIFSIWYILFVLTAFGGVKTDTFTYTTVITFCSLMIINSLYGIIHLPCQFIWLVLMIIFIALLYISILLYYDFKKRR